MRRKICFIAEGMVDFRLVDGLSEFVDLTLVTRESSSDRATSQPAKSRFQLLHGPQSRIDFGLFVWRFLCQESGNFDSVVVQGYSVAAFGANLAMFGNNQSLFLLVCAPSEEYYACRKTNPTPGKRYWPIVHLAWFVLARLNAALTNNYVVLSEYLAGVVRSHGAPCSKIRVIPVYGVNLQVFHPASISRDALRRQLGLPQSGKLLFYSSRISPEKDFRTVLRAHKRLLDCGIDAWLMNASGGYEDFLEEARKVGVAQKVIARNAAHPFAGLCELYQASDVCIQASLAEGLGFAPLEALSCGVPVVASTVGGLKETIQDGVTGWSVPPGDDEKLAAVLVEVFKSKDEARRRTEKGRQLVVNKFDQTEKLREFIELLNQSLVNR